MEATGGGSGAKAGVAGFAGGSRDPRAARLVFLGSCAALAVALLVQTYLAGVAAMTDPSWWDLHRAWVNVFQWLVLLPVASAVLARYPKWLVGMSVLPVVLIYSQYVWIELAREAAWAYASGAHAANALVLFGSTVFLLAAAPYAVAPRPRRPTPPGLADGSGQR